MKTRIAAAVTALVLGVAAPASSAWAVYDGPVDRFGSSAPYDVTTTGSIAASDGRLYDRCPMNSAAEGNANQQNFPVKQYGQTAGGNRC